MNPVLGPEFESLLRAAMDGSPESVDWPGLEAILDENPEALAAYVELITVHALLQWRSGRKSDTAAQNSDVPTPTFLPGVHRRAGRIPSFPSPACRQRPDRRGAE